MDHPTDRITHTTAFVTPVVEHWLEREIAQWVHPMKDRSDDPSHHERTLLPRSYKPVIKITTKCIRSFLTKYAKKALILSETVAILTLVNAAVCIICLHFK